MAGVFDRVLSKASHLGDMGGADVPQFQIGAKSSPGDGKPKPMLSLTGDDSSVDSVCMIQVPDWIPASRRRGRFYLYVSTTHGRAVHLFVSDDESGPWELVSGVAGVLNIADVVQVTEETGDAVSDPAAAAAAKASSSADLTVSVPDVHVDGGVAQLRLYFCVRDKRGNCATRVAVSSDGLVAPV
mgnify:CR=1 FL=1